MTSLLEGLEEDYDKVLEAFDSNETSEALAMYRGLIFARLFCHAVDQPQHVGYTMMNEGDGPVFDLSNMKKT